MKKIMLAGALGLMLLLSSCSNGKEIDNNKGTIDCYSIKITNGGKTTSSWEYHINYSYVYEYKDISGKAIYTNSHMMGYDSNYNQVEYSIRLFDNRYNSDYIEYTYAGFVGYLTVEYNYYLDLENMVVDSDTKWLEYLYSTDPTTQSGDNKKAYECAQKNYYQISGSAYPSATGELYFTIRNDMAQTGLERHEYTKLGNDEEISYVVKWF